MKVKEFVKKMNNHGTQPRIKILKHEEYGALVVYEGRPDNADEWWNVNINSFTILGKGLVEIHIS